MSIWIGDIEILTKGRLVKYAHLAPECYESVASPTDLIPKIIEAQYDLDLFAFGQRLPDVEPRYPYYYEWQPIAALRVTSYENWLNRQIIKENRKNVAKAIKRGVDIRVVEYDDGLVAGIADIYNETPVRQGKRFSHYEKSLEAVRKENGTYIDKSIFIGAYYQDTLIGFIKVVLTEKCASTLQVISKIQHRDKKPNNALLAKAVEICASKNIPYLQYGVWSTGTLGKFKATNGFERLLIPHYLVPVTRMGSTVLKLRLHRPLVSHVPEAIVANLIRLRSKIYKTFYGRP
jgi:hypothetical protein